MGRPKKDIDPNIVGELASILCTMNEIAAVVGCSVDTLERRFADIIKNGRENGKQSLRRKQWKLADTSAAMAIFLGKNYLGQRDVAVEDSNERDTAILEAYGNAMEDQV